MRTPNEKKMFDLLLDEVDDTLVGIEKRALSLESADQTKELQVIFRGAHNVKGASQLYGLNDFGNVVHVFEDLLGAIQKHPLPLHTASIDMILTAQAFLRDWVRELRNDPKYLADATTFRDQLKSHIEDLTTGRLVKDVVLEPAPAEDTAATPSPATPVTAPLNGAAAKRRQRRAASLRVSSEKIDEIIQFIGELSINQGILWHNYQQGTFNILNCKNAVTLNQKSLKELYDLVLTLRMQPAESLFQRMEKTARDIARDQNKKLQVTLQGADIPLDKTVIELITDPMMHLVRNAVDHGVESQAERARSGKTETARLSIATAQESGQVVITISDDGRGLDTELLHEKAIKKGLLDPRVPISDEELMQLIYAPGFSTRDQVSEISGRGVGMDVVQKAIQSLGGRIETHSKKGHGTSFQITLPASLEIIDGLQVRVNETTYIVPRQDVEEIVDLNSYQVETLGNRGSRAIRLRERLVPVETLAEYIGGGGRAGALPGDPVSISTTASSGLIVRLHDRSRLILGVDQVVSQQQIVVRPLSEQLSKVPGFAGVTILGNGEPAMIVSMGYIGDCYLRWIQDQGISEGRSA